MLTKKEKQAHCALVTDIVLQHCGHQCGSGDSSRTAAANAALNAGMETLLYLADDAAPDVRITADEALNKLVRVSFCVIKW